MLSILPNPSKISSGKLSDRSSERDHYNRRNIICESIIKSRVYEWGILLVSVAYLIELIVCAYFEDKHQFNGIEITITIGQQPPVFLVFDVIKLIIMMIYMVDNTAYACTYGLNKKVRIFSLIFETVLIGVIIAMTVIQIADETIRFKEFYLRLLDLVLIFRKLLVAQMLFI
jgi:hypothetical protein